MGHWGFVFLAYGIVWTAILLYLVLLKSRLKHAEAEKTLLQKNDRNENHE